jgi:regulator of sigma E protease
MTLVYSLIVFAVLIFVHELGHFITAKMFGVKVNEFALGMGPVLLKKQKGETQYSLRAVPIGGFCAMEGEDEDSGDERAFNQKPSWQRAIILAAGSTMNVILAIVILSAILFSIGQPSTVVDEVFTGSPAEVSGIIAGDRIVAIENQEIDKWDDITLAIGDIEPEQNIVIQVVRDRQEVTINSSTYQSEDGRTVVGITPTFVKNPGRSLVDGVKSTWAMLVSMVDILKQLFTGDIPATDLTGPVGIVYMVGDSAKLGTSYVAYLAALISLNLAIINMLPLPALDGGRLLFLVIRKISGKRVTDKMEAKVHMIGIILLLALMVYVTWQDIIRFIVPGFGG